VRWTEERGLPSAVLRRLSHWSIRTREEYPESGAISICDEQVAAAGVDTATLSDTSEGGKGDNQIQGANSKRNLAALSPSVSRPTLEQHNRACGLRNFAPALRRFLY